MSSSIRAMGPSLAKLGASRLQPLLSSGRRIGAKISEKSRPASTGGWMARPWDPNNRIRVIGATIGVIGGGGMLFDTFYRRVTKKELDQAMEKVDARIDKLDAKIDKLDAKIDGVTNALNAKIDGVANALNVKIDGVTNALNAKIDGLTNALLHTSQRDRIAAEAENRELRMENERLKSKEAH